MSDEIESGELLARARASGFEPEGGFPEAYLSFVERALEYDGHAGTAGSGLLYNSLIGRPLDFCEAIGMGPDDVRDWLEERGLEAEPWFEMFPGHAPLAFWTDDDEDVIGTQDETREFLMVDLRSPACPVLMFYREGGASKCTESLEEFLESLE